MPLCARSWMWSQNSRRAAGSTPAVGREQPADHADGGGLAAAVGAEESVDRAARHLHREVIDDRVVAEALREVAHVDREIGVHGILTSTGWPGCSRVASAAAGRAS